MMNIKYYLQKLLGTILDRPLIPQGRTTGYSLVKSEKTNCDISQKAKVIAPFYLHHVELGAYSYIARNSRITNCIIGKFCSLGPNFCCGLGFHPIDGISTSPMFYSVNKQNGFSLCKENKVVESCQTRIGNDVYICAGSTVMARVRDGRKVMGNPAKLIRVISE